uniref:eukaryotic translation initiation factor 5A-1-like isoform X1 n=2 Tax=Solea senegalensis TaxID=28829 RepID=UPI001CD89197|nr:eukaryotic translation initiation factor 5A-1-like isoform X1 [Solea senegalensis]
MCCCAITVWTVGLAFQNPFLHRLQLTLHSCFGQTSASHWRLGWAVMCSTFLQCCFLVSPCSLTLGSPRTKGKRLRRSPPSSRRDGRSWRRRRSHDIPPATPCHLSLFLPLLVQKLHVCQVTSFSLGASRTKECIMGDDSFDIADSGASLTYPMQCSALRKNGHVMLKGRPCKIVDMSTSKTGKHGDAKVHLVGVDIFTKEKYEDICPSTHNMEVPNVTRKDYQVLNISDGLLSLMDDTEDIREDLKLPENEMGKEIDTRFAQDQEFKITVLEAIGEEQIVAVK